LRQTRFPSHDEDGDQLIEARDAALAQKRGQGRLDPPPAAHRQLLSGPSFEETGKNAG